MLINTFNEYIILILSPFCYIIIYYYYILYYIIYVLYCCQLVVIAVTFFSFQFIHAHALQRIIRFIVISSQSYDIGKMNPKYSQGPEMQVCFQIDSLLHTSVHCLKMLP